MTCDNSYTLYVNGKRLQAGANWEAPDLVALTNLKVGANEILIVAQNAGSVPTLPGYSLRPAGPMRMASR